MNQQAIGAGETPREKGIRYLNSRIQPLPTVFILLTVAMLMQLFGESSNKKQIHTPTIFVAFLNLLFWVLLFGLIYNLDTSPSDEPSSGYVAVKVFLHACVLCLVTLSFSLSLMMRMNLVVTISTLAAAGVFIAHRMWQCRKIALNTDVGTYTGLEEVIQHLIELSTMATSMLLGGWFSTAFFYFQNFPEEEHDARLLPSEYLTFFTSVAASLILVKSVPRRSEQPVWEMVALVYALYTGLMVLAQVIAASMVGRYAPLALIPEAVAFAVWFVLWAKDKWRPGPPQPAPLQGEAPQDTLVLVAFAVLLGMLSYKVKDFAQVLSTLYDEVFVVFITAAGVAAVGWRLLTQPPIPTRSPGVEAAAKTLAQFAICLLLLSLLMFFGIMVRLVRSNS